MFELASTHTKSMIDVLLNVHALTNMHRASGNEEYRKSAADWLPHLDDLLASLHRELNPKEDNANGSNGDWIPWAGGACPVAASTTVAIERKNGMNSNGLAANFQWKQDGWMTDIIAYKVIKP